MESDVKRNVSVLAIFGFIRGICVSIFQTLFPLYLLELGYSIESLGIIATVSSMIAGFALLFIGVLMDHVGRKPIIVITAITLSACLIIVPLTESYEILLLAYILYYFSFIVSLPARGALLADSVELNVMGEATGVVSTGFLIGRTFTPYLAGVGADTLGYFYVFVGGFIIAIIGVIVVSLFIVESKNRTIVPPRSRSYLKNMIFYEKKLMWLYLFTCIDRFAWLLWVPLLNAYLKDVFDMSGGEVGGYNTIANITMSISQYRLGKLIDRIGYVKGLLISEITGFIASIIIGLSPTRAFLALGFILIGLSVTLWVPSYNAALALSSPPSDRGKVFSSINAMRTIGSIPAPWIGGEIYEEIGASSPFICSSAILIVNSILLFKLCRRTTIDGSSMCQPMGNLSRSL